MDENINTTIIQTNVGLAALLNLLEEKGVITEAEYIQKFDELKEIVINSFVEEIKKKFD